MPPFGWSARDRMLHAEAGEDFQVAVVHLHRDMNREFAVGIAQDPPQAFVKIEFLRGQIEASACASHGLVSLSTCAGVVIVVIKVVSGMIAGRVLAVAGRFRL